MILDRSDQMIQRFLIEIFPWLVRVSLEVLYLNLVKGSFDVRGFGFGFGHGVVLLSMKKDYITVSITLPTFQ